MKLNLDDITFIIVTYQSEHIIKNCLDSLPRDSKKIIIENSNNINLKRDLESKYDNIEVILSQNIGMGAGNNIGLKLCKTSCAFVLNPDTKFRKDTIVNFLETLNDIPNFALASPLNDDPKIPNYKKIIAKINDNTLSVDSIDGFSMLFNLKKFKDQNFFDENFFLYLENNDLCLRVKQKNENIYVVTNSLINHKGSISTSQKLEYLRNWHWMWSKFYFNKKHYGYLVAFFKVFRNLISAKLKFFYYLITLNTFKRKIYQMRLLGLISSMIGKNSYYRPKL